MRYNAVLLGAGQRGYEVFGKYALRKPENIRFAAVAEPDSIRRERFANEHNIPSDMCFDSWQELLEHPELSDFVINATPDRIHYASTIAAVRKGYDVLLEKPMGVTEDECRGIVNAIKEYGKRVDICHVLRYTPFFRKVKEIVDSGRIGEIVSIEHKENVGFFHQAHSYVRGNWRNEAGSSPMILAKSCHDLDILIWLMGRKCRKVSSFGSLKHFNISNKPHGAPERCLDGCHYDGSCIYNAKNIYLTEYTGWPVSAVSSDLSYDARLKAIKEGPYGRCVFACDNDVVDHQVTNLEFEGGATAAFTMCGFTLEMTRKISIFGTKAELTGDMASNDIIIKDFSPLNALIGLEERIKVEAPSEGHGGGDDGLLDSYIGSLVKNIPVPTAAENSLESHLIAFAAEKSRHGNRIVEME